ncbi:MAG: transglycosylase SLT domain-containing protein [Betaproteobacteria bacterium]
MSDNEAMTRTILHPWSERLRAAVAAIAVAAAPAVFAQSDGDFVAAKSAFERGDTRALDALASSLSGHVLARYVEYWQLKSHLNDASPEMVKSFLGRYPDGPLAERLRVDWLKALGKRGDWPSFAASHASYAGDDSEIACYAAQMRYQRDGAVALAAVKSLWFTGQSTPDACAPLFAALLGRGDLSVDDRRARLRLAAANGNSRLVQALAGDLGGADRIALGDLVAIDRDPVKRFAKGAFGWKTTTGRELALYALERAARKDAGDAHDAWRKWRTAFPASDRAYGDLRIAYHAARQLNPSAHLWFRDVGHATLTADEHAWRIRAALRAAAWTDVANAIDALPATDQQEPMWRYWRARALAAQHRSEDARALYAGLAGGASYYGLLAAEALGTTSPLATLGSRPLAIDEAAIASFGKRPDVIRAVKLAQLDVRIEGIREWNYAVRGMTDEALLLAAEYALRVGLYDRAIYTAERTATRHDFALRYLTPFRLQFANAAREQGIDEALLYGIARQESRFVADIVSSAGAVGLMQLMPGTARWVSKRIATPGYDPSRIADVDINTQFGAFYFRYWQDRLGQLPALAAAAYNAGPARAQAWRPASGSLEGAIWVETIPFNETRDYVKRVLANTVLYAHALERPYVPLSTRLGVVTPRESASVTAGDS